MWERRSALAGGGEPFYLVTSGRRALAGIAANLLGHPERRLKVSAVTGNERQDDDRVFCWSRC